jgi:PKD repeat protein
MWKQETSTNFINRFNDLYVQSGLPTMIFGGDKKLNSGDSIENIFAEQATRHSPFILDGIFSSISETELQGKLRVHLIKNYNTDNVKVFMFLTDHNHTELTNTIQVGASEQLDLNISTENETEEFECEFTISNELEVDNIRMVGIIQDIETKRILQADEFFVNQELNADFRSEITFGPPSLEVLFQNLSKPSMDYDLIEWDFDNDGNIDSNDQHPKYLYTSPGSYSVTMKITKDGVTEEITKENYITVLESNSIYGNVSGHWNTENSPYLITDNCIVPEDSKLIIDEGVELIFSEDKNITIFGKLEINGTLSNPVTLSSETSWNGISIQSKLDSCNISGAIISNCEDSVLTIHQAKVEVRNCQFIDNNTTPIQVFDSENTVISQNFITRNSSSNYCGAIGAENSTIKVNNNLIVHNSGNLASVIALKENSNAILINNTISNNAGNVVIFQHSSELEIINSIIRSETNNIFTNIASSPLISYSCLSSEFTGEGNFVADPQFLEPNDNWNAETFTQPEHWICSDNSDCIDAGNVDEIYNDIEDPNSVGNPLYPAQGSLRNDVGAFGGEGFDTNMIVQSNDDNIEVFKSEVVIYPNPFYPNNSRSNDVKISFSSNKEETANINIYNVKGQKVKKLGQHKITKGNNIILWNGKLDRNSKAANGIYFVIIKSQSQVSTGKFLLLK